jgi:hypothetical protein
MLWATLQPFYPDQATFVPSVAAVIAAWCDAFTTWIEGDDNSEAVERLLEALKGSRSLKLFLEVRLLPQFINSWAFFLSFCFIMDFLFRVVYYVFYLCYLSSS